MEGGIKGKTGKLDEPRRFAARPFLQRGKDSDPPLCPPVYDPSVNLTRVQPLIFQLQNRSKWAKYKGRGHNNFMLVDFMCF